MTKDLGNYKIKISFKLKKEELDEDILCDEKGDWKLDLTGDWMIASGEKAFEQDLDESYHLKPFEDILDIQEGNEIREFINANYANETAIELKQSVLEWLSKDDRIDQNTVEVQVERA